MLKTYIFLRKARFRKKLHLYKLAFLLIFDLVSLFYMLVLFGYIAFAILKEGDLATWRYQFDFVMGGIVLERIWSVMTVLPLFMLIRSFQYPGISFTSAERLASILPNKLSNIWFLTALSRWIKSTLIYLFIGITFYLLSPSSLSIVTLYIAILLFLNMIMTPIEWKFFQYHIIIKIIIFTVALAINILSVLLNSGPFSVVFLVTLCLLALITHKQRFVKIDWQRVTAASDYKLWNMKVISRASKISFKKDRQYSVWQRLPVWKKPFPYKELKVYHRLWFIYFEKNILLILQFFGAMLLLLFVFVFINDFIFFLGVAFVIHAYTSVVASFYSDRFTTDIVQIIPWHVGNFRRTLFKWATSFGTIFLLPFILYVILNFQSIVFVQLLFILASFQVLFHLKIYKMIQGWQSTFEINSIPSIIGYGLLICLILSPKIMFVLYVGIGLVAIQTVYSFPRVKND